MWIFYHDMSSGVTQAPVYPFVAGGVFLGMLFAIVCYGQLKEKTK